MIKQILCIAASLLLTISAVASAAAQTQLPDRGPQEVSDETKTRSLCEQSATLSEQEQNHCCQLLRSEQDKDPAQSAANGDDPATEDSKWDLWRLACAAPLAGGPAGAAAATGLSRGSVAIFGVAIGVAAAAGVAAVGAGGSRQGTSTSSPTATSKH